MKHHTIRGRFAADPAYQLSSFGEPDVRFEDELFILRYEDKKKGRWMELRFTTCSDATLVGTHVPSDATCAVTEYAEWVQWRWDSKTHLEFWVEITLAMKYCLSQ